MKWGEWHLTPDENSVSGESWGCRCCLGMTLLIAHLESRTSCRVKLSWWGGGSDLSRMGAAAAHRGGQQLSVLSVDHKC